MTTKEKLQRFLGTGKFRTTYAWIDKGTVGICDYLQNLIVLNIELFVASVFVHEETHRKHPTWSERRVEKAEKRAMKRMTVKQIRQLARKVHHKVTGHKLETEVYH